MDSDLALSGILSLALFGFTGSLHCAAMCGALAASACGAPATSTDTGLAGPFFQYHVARLLAYSLLGFVAGLLSAMTVGHWLAEEGKVLGLVFGAVTILYALNELRRAVMRTRSKGVTGLSAWQKAIRRVHGGILALPFPRPLLLGLTTALLPCGFLAAALLQAALLAHPVYSALGMLGFGLASSPALIGGSGLLRIVTRKWPRLTPILVALVLLLAGASIIFRALQGQHHHHQ